MAGCSNSSVPLTTSFGGAFGTVPAAAAGAQHAGTVTWAEPPNGAPTWILPLTTAEASSAGNVLEFEYEMWRPLYWFDNGAEPTESAAMSLASPPVWSNGDKTVSISLNGSYKWSDGRPVTSRDVVFWFDEVKAAIKESPVNWASYTPGLGIPDQVASVTARGARTVVFTLDEAVNPEWFWDDELSTVAHGWTVRPGITDVCAKAGTGAGECGAGIPAGTRLAFNLIFGTLPPYVEEMNTDLASQAAKAGITISLQPSNFNFIATNYDNAAPADKASIDKWAMADFGGYGDAPYPTTLGTFNSTGMGNLGSYENPTADKPIAASVTSGDAAAVKAEASFLTADQPVLFQPNPDWIAVWKKDLSGLPDSFTDLTQFYLTPEYWYFTG
jgi:ABC-type transport system substrate-binding protein